MNPFAYIARKAGMLLSRNRFRSDLDEEMAFHREQVEKDLIADGMTRHVSSATQRIFAKRAIAWLPSSGKPSDRICASRSASSGKTLGSV